ncbi:Hypothetical protein ORPV_1125 [Orpheovirus IHUMI-LCC2]|uniref:Uncharacterized protein n=1 Tax=Orpheovirus IHUMI-LCC2 TaxID=2023057 RepID=A0A2I2L6D6_9VIRU|nr:Hypothetical protein ORPV_1125 [Orpheovirus IHUMI-LCC2]SNW63029.1 Hypothetical protein ORPV_1125 [Orpheovirus IHUMI-LCC2]
MQNNFSSTYIPTSTQLTAYGTYDPISGIAPMEYSYAQSSPSILSPNFPKENTYKTGNISLYSTYDGIYNRENSRLSIKGVPLLDLPVYNNINEVDVGLKRTGGNVNAGKLDGIIPIKRFPEYNKKRQGSVVFNINRIGNVIEEDIGRSNNIMENKDSILTYIGM